VLSSFLMFKLLHPHKDFILLVFSLILSFNVQSQYLEIDSLESLLKTNLPENVRVKMLYQISRELVYVDPVRAMEYAKESEKLALKLKSRIDQAYAYRIFSAVYASKGFYSLATEVGLKAFQIFEEEGDSLGLANYYITTGNLYRIQNFHTRSAHFHRLSYEYFKKHGPASRFAITALNYGESLIYLDSLSKAVNLLRVAMKINDTINNLSAQTFTYNAMGLAYNKMNMIDSAAYYFEKVIAASKILGENSQKAATIESMVHLADLYAEKGDVRMQEIMLEGAKNFAIQFYKGKVLVDIYLQLMNFNLKQGNAVKALYYSDKFRAIGDSLDNITTRDREAMLGTLYTTIKVNVENEFLEDQHAFSQQVIKEQRMYIITISILGFIILIAMAVVSISLMKLKKSNLLLNEQKEQINQKSEELEALSKTKDKIFSIISHDLRSPLLSLIGFSDLVSGHIKELSEKEIVDTMEQLRSNVDATLKMTDNLIQWGMLQMEQATVNPTSFDVNIIISELYVLYKNLANQKDISINVDKGKSCFVYADYDQVELILRNLLNNAIKFTEQGGEITIEAIQKKETSIIKVKDNGLGIEREMMADLFKLKAASTAGTKGERGSGLGLMLCYEYALKNEGIITVDSTLGKGSEFSLVLPLLA
jgi:signal transduction histidine kinase